MYKFNKYVSSVICLMRYFRFRKKSVDLHIYFNLNHILVKSFFTFPVLERKNNI